MDGAEISVVVPVFDLANHRHGAGELLGSFVKSMASLHSRCGLVHLQQHLSLHSDMSVQTCLPAELLVYLEGNLMLPAHACLISEVTSLHRAPLSPPFPSAKFAGCAVVGARMKPSLEGDRVELHTQDVWSCSSNSSAGELALGRQPGGGLTGPGARVHFFSNYGDKVRA